MKDGCIMIDIMNRINSQTSAIPRVNSIEEVNSFLNYLILLNEVKVSKL